MAAKKLRFLNPNTAPPNSPTHWDVLWDVWCKVWPLVATMFGITLVCAFLYYIGTPQGWGIRPTFESNEKPTEVTFVDCIYFSVVTIATLGYGDYRPESLGRLVAGFEVLSGIVLMGIFVACLVSRQQDRLTKRLLSGQLNQEIQSFREQLRDLLQAFNDDRSPLEPMQSSELLYRADGLVRSIARYWRYQSPQPDLADVLPLRPACRLLGELIDLVNTVSDRVNGQARETMHANNVRHVRNVVESTLTVAVVLNDHTDDHGIQHLYDQYVELADGIRVQLKLHVP